MNQNRNNNRRRGRGSNRGQGGNNQGNRIDSRARGNAPQMLEKYRKLAHDASLNGDRVQTEYYLQFADHYFRVVADSRAQKEEQQPRREHQRDDREPSSGYDSDEYEVEDHEGREQRHGRRDRDDDERGDDRHEDRGGERTRGEEGQRAAEGDEVDGNDNPFTRDARGSRDRSGQRGRGRGRAANDADAGYEPNGRASEEREAVAEEAGFDPGILPPSIPRDEEPAPRPRGRGRKARPAEDNGDEPLEAVS